MKYEERPLTHEMCLRIQNDLMNCCLQQSQAIRQGCGYSVDGTKIYEPPFGQLYLCSDSTYVQEVDGDGYFLLVDEAEIDVFCLFFEGKLYRITTYFLSDYLATPTHIEDLGERRRVMDSVMAALSVYDGQCCASWLLVHGFKDKDYYEAHKPNHGWA
jgi:hypothetical protein